MTKMKSFFWGALGALFVLIAAALIVPQYCDYRAQATVFNWRSGIGQLQASIEQRLLSRDSSIELPEGVMTSPDFSPKHHVRAFKVTSTGVIIIQGENTGFMSGQLMVLFPSLEQEKVMWTCYGGPEKLMPTSWCDGKARPSL